MVAACILRRQQLIVKGMADPYESRAVGHRSGVSTVGDLVTGRLDADDLYVGVVGCSLQEIR